MTCNFTLWEFAIDAVILFVPFSFVFLGAALHCYFRPLLNIFLTFLFIIIILRVACDNLFYEIFSNYMDWWLTWTLTVTEAFAVGGALRRDIFAAFTT